MELGAYEINKLRRPSNIEFWPWTVPSSLPESKTKRAARPRKPKRDRLKLAREYQEMLDSGTVASRAELARHLGVSRARVTQVLNRLSEIEPPF